MVETAFGYFPDYDIAWDVRVGRRYKTQIVTSVTGKEQRRRLYPPPAGDGTDHRGGYGYMTCNSGDYDITQRTVVADFLDSLEGSFRAFYVWRRDRDNYTNFDVGTVASVTSLIIPFKESVVTTVTTNNVGQAFTVSLGVGTGGEDRLNFAVQTGTVRVTLRGRERWLVRADMSDEVIETFRQNIVSQKVIVPLNFKQVR